VEGIGFTQWLRRRGTFLYNPGHIPDTALGESGKYAFHFIVLNDDFRVKRNVSRSLIDINCATSKVPSFTDASNIKY
jgi:hypothetical protein